jgi:predicted HD phosphohydrolase
MGITYRVEQFLRSVFPRISASERGLVYQILSPDLAGLFSKMSRADQLHSLRVFNLLRQTGQDDPDLLAAALLHDVGKSLSPLNPIQRAVVVLANLAAPKLVNRLGREKNERGAWKPLITAVQHPRWGADLVERHGGSTRLINLIRLHQEPLSPTSPPDLQPLIALLQQADNRN